MSRFILEACADSVESVEAAKKGGADRVELCGNLIIGGTTPSPCMFEEIRKYTDIRIHVLIRPRSGDFCYTEHEFQIMKKEIKMYRSLGAEGVVFGILKPDGNLNTYQMAELAEEAGDMWLTLHRAFDVCKDPYQALEEAIELGFDTILTSGQKDTCKEGTGLLRSLQQQGRGRIQLQAGAGISGEVIGQIYRETGIQAYHMSGKRRSDSLMQYRKEHVNMGQSSVSEYEIFRTDEEKIRSARRILDLLAERE